MRTQDAVAYDPDVSAGIIGAAQSALAERAARRAQLRLICCDSLPSVESPLQATPHVAAPVPHGAGLVQRWLADRARPFVAVWRVLSDRCPACGSEVDVYSWKHARCPRCGHDC
jgi:hypothetical protein